jgi:hypothetical protein
MGLIIPHSHVIHQKPPKYACTLCPAVFTEDERFQFERHVIRGHSVEDLREVSLQAKAPGLFDPNHESGDVEWGRYIDRKHKEDPHGWAKWMRTDDGNR